MKNYAEETRRSLQERRQWEKYNAHTFEDQHPGCQTHCGGFDYVRHTHPADKAIDKAWLEERRTARKQLLTLLARRAS